MISSNLKKRSYTSLSLLLILFLMFNFKLLFVYIFIITGALSVLEFIQICKKIFNKKIYVIISYTFFSAILLTIFSLIVFFISFIQIKITIFIILLGCISSDVGGFIVGKLLQGPKLTKISPNKTISGAFGSLLFSCICVSVIFFYFNQNFTLKPLIVGLITSLACQVGDLFFSYLKRKAKLKDTGNFLPGHGGVLDRIDGILFGLPIGFVTMILIY
tara:strand:+ start:584 stop:1234 length:651 start_codon:yes stop_codon:yes gene_type:complete